MENLKKQILYVSIDNVLCDFSSTTIKVEEKDIQKNKHRQKLDPDIYAIAKPTAKAINALRELSKMYDIYILSSAPCNNPAIWSAKLEWVIKNLGKEISKRLIISNHQELCKGDFLIISKRDIKKTYFEGRIIGFGSRNFPDWDSILEYLMPQPKPTTYKNLSEILTLSLPLRTDTFLHRIKSKDQVEDELGDYYDNILEEKASQIKEGKYGDLNKDFEYHPNFGWYGDTKCFIFKFGDYKISVTSVDISIDNEGEFNEVIAHLQCIVESNNQEEESLYYNDDDNFDDGDEEYEDEDYENCNIPDYLKALDFDAECEFECLEEDLDTIFSEISKCKERYLASK